MKKICFFFLCLTFQLSASNKVNHDNYYEKLTRKPLTHIDWLRVSDAVPVIIDELKENGFHRAFINVGLLVDDGLGNKVVVHVSYNRNDTTFGFIYKEGHSIQVNKKHREALLQQKEIKENFFQSYLIKDIENNCLKTSGNSKIDLLPQNIFVLDENCYFFEENDYDEDAKYPLSKEKITEILRYDIRTFLKKIEF